MSKVQPTEQKNRPQLLSSVHTNNQSDQNVNEPQQVKKGESKQDKSNEIEKEKEKLNDNFKSLVTRVLNKDSESIDFKNFQFASDLRHWIIDFEAKDFWKMDQLKTKKVISVNEIFKSKFSSEIEFFNWFQPNNHNQINEIFIKYKNEIDKKIDKLNDNKRKRQTSKRFEKNYQKQKESNVYDTWRSVNWNNNNETKLKNQIRVYKNKILHNKKNNIKNKFFIDQDTRFKILKLHNEKKSIKEIADSLGLKQGSVQMSIQRFKNSKNNRFFSRHDIIRKKFTNSQLNQIEDHIENNFESGDGAKTLINWIKEKYEVEIDPSQAQSLLRQFGFKRVKSESVQYDNSTKSMTLARHLFNLQIISTLIESGIEIQTLDEFGLNINRRGSQVYKKPKVRKYYKAQSNQDKKFNVAIACNKQLGPFNIQISINPQNSVLQHEFVLKVKDFIVDHQLHSNKPKIILVDSAAFHNWGPTMNELEDSDSDISYMLLGGLISMLNPVEYIIHRIKANQRVLENKTEIQALESLHKVISEFKEIDALRCYKVCVSKWIQINNNITDMLKSRLSQ